jgi:hypothetical protein
MVQALSTPPNTYIHIMGKLERPSTSSKADAQVYSHITQRTMSKLALLFPIPTLSVVSPLLRPCLELQLMDSGRKR